MTIDNRMAQVVRTSLLIDKEVYTVAISDRPKPEHSLEHTQYVIALDFWWLKLTALERASLLISNPHLLESSTKQFSSLIQKIKFAYSKGEPQ